LKQFDGGKLTDELMEAGGLDGRRVWLRVLKAIEVLLDKGPTVGESRRSCRTALSSAAKLEI